MSSRPATRPLAPLFAAAALGALALFTPTDGHATAGPRASETPEADASSFDRTAASSALSGVDITRCKRKFTGEGHLLITFASKTGKAKYVTIDQGPFVAGPESKCITAAFKKAKVPAFRGKDVTVGKAFKLE